jgi:hypothetical protein
MGERTELERGGGVTKVCCCSEETGAVLFIPSVGTMRFILVSSCTIIVVICSICSWRALIAAVDST